MFISYAQNYEDVVLWRALQDVGQGFYVDIGAADPNEESVTCAFYERGWSGINVEPLGEYFERLVTARPRDTNLKVAVGKEAGVQTFYTFEKGLSTLAPEMSARHQADGLRALEMAVPVLTLNKILEDQAVSTIHFLKIDVEGAETEALEGLDLRRFRPWIVVIEATEPNSTVSTRHKWEHLVTGQGYGFAYFDGLNCFYVAEEKSFLSARLAIPPNVFDDFVRRTESAQQQDIERAHSQIRDLTEMLNTNRQEAENWREALNAEQARTAGLTEALNAEQARTAGLTEALNAEQIHGAWLTESLRSEQARSTSLLKTLDAERARIANLEAIMQDQANHLLIRLQQLETELKLRIHYSGMFGSLREITDKATGGGIRQFGNRVTGGGLRSLARRLISKSIAGAMRNPILLRIGRTILKPYPSLAANLYKLATVPIEATVIPVISSKELHQAATNDVAASLPVSARPTFERLRCLVMHNVGESSSK
jgi:FkbM family methyltransferase